jgi:O-antigen ligase
MNLSPKIGLRELLLTSILLLCGLTDGVRRLSLGPVTALAGVTIVANLGCFVMLLNSRRFPKPLVLSAIGYLSFLGLGIYSMTANLPFSGVSFQNSVQNLLSYGAFIGMLLLSACLVLERETIPWFMRHGFLVSVAIATTLYGIGILVKGPGSELMMGARAFATFVVSMLPFALAAWRYQVPFAGIISIGMTVCVALSFSRSATVIALILYPLSRFSPHKPEGWVRMGLWVGLISLVAYLSFTYVQPIRDRFTEKGDNASIGGVKVNTSGREEMWAAVRVSIEKAPLLGQGPGSVEVPISRVNKTAGGHPHNDYLRLIHDFGYVGFTMWLLSWIGLIGVTFRNWLWADTVDRNLAHYHLGALLGMLSMSQLMLTDNIVVYIFATLPLGMLIGSSIALGVVRRSQFHQINRPNF